MENSKPARAKQVISFEVIARQRDQLQAISLSIQVSGLEPKQIYKPLGIDKGTWSNIMSGQMHFPTNKYEQFMDIVGNEILLIWLAFRRGKGLHDLVDAKDKRINDLEAKIAEKDKEIETLIKYGVLTRKGND